MNSGLVEITRGGVPFGYAIFPNNSEQDTAKAIGIGTRVILANNEHGAFFLLGGDKCLTVRGQVDPLTNKPKTQIFYPEGAEQFTVRTILTVEDAESSPRLNLSHIFGQLFNLT